jgi:hypothetical protein
LLICHAGPRPRPISTQKSLRHTGHTAIHPHAHGRTRGQRRKELQHTVTSVCRGTTSRDSQALVFGRDWRSRPHYLWDLVDLSVVVMTVVCTATLTLPVHSHLHTTTQAQHWQQPTSPSFGLCPFVPRKACLSHVTPPLKLTPLPATSVPPQVSPALPPTPTPKAHRQISTFCKLLPSSKHQ